MSEVLDLVLIAGVAGGAAAYVYNFKGFKDWVDSQLHFGGNGGCTGHCTGNTHLVTSSCTCVPNDCTKTCQAGQHVSSTCTCVPDTTGGTGTWYRANGPSKAMPWGRVSSGRCGDSSGGSSGGNRWENDFPGGMKMGYEVVMYVQIKQGSMCKGGHVGLKHGGPHHTPPCGYTLPKGAVGNCGTTGTCCCWWDSGVHNDDQLPYLERERSHNDNCGRKLFPKINTKLDSGKPIGFRWHISREGSGIRLMMWLDTAGVSGGNKWQLIYNVLDTGQIMPREYYSKIPNEQNVEIRISDVASGNIKMTQAPMSRMIVAGSGYTQVLPTGHVSRFTDLVTPIIAD